MDNYNALGVYQRINPFYTWVLAVVTSVACGLSFHSFKSTYYSISASRQQTSRCIKLNGDLEGIATRCSNSLNACSNRLDRCIATAEKCNATSEQCTALLDTCVDSTGLYSDPDDPLGICQTELRICKNIYLEHCQDESDKLPNPNNPPKSMHTPDNIDEWENRS